MNKELDSKQLELETTLQYLSATTMVAALLSTILFHFVLLAVLFSVKASTFVWVIYSLYLVCSVTTSVVTFKLRSKLDKFKYVE